uniref:redoxin domain-containing protein n=1 Tax=Ningiella ruwaisensis TaxID=2364274 RepID=UPI0010A08702|nr:redoxin domain-containing protein [Ningiella ruwaisensis]
MSSIDAKPGSIFPDIQVSTRDSEEVSLIPKIKSDFSRSENTWYAIVIYRGQHCPICANYLNELANKQNEFEKLNVKLVAVSTDSVEQLNQFYKEKISDVSFPVYANLKLDVAKHFGLYLSSPMSASETDHVFTEPALFVVNPQRQVQIVDVANAPFIRPKVDTLLAGIKHIQENVYPIRGEYEHN